MDSTKRRQTSADLLIDEAMAGLDSTDMASPPGTRPPGVDKLRFPPMVRRKVLPSLEEGDRSNSDGGQEQKNPLFVIPPPVHRVMSDEGSETTAATAATVATTSTASTSTPPPLPQPPPPGEAGLRPVVRPAPNPQSEQPAASTPTTTGSDSSRPTAPPPVVPPPPPPPPMLAALPTPLAGTAGSVAFAAPPPLPMAPLPTTGVLRPKRLIEPKTKMKHFNWVKIPAAKVPSSLWQEINDDQVALDTEELEALFSAQKAPAPKEKDGTSSLLPFFKTLLTH